MLLKCLVLQGREYVCVKNRHPNIVKNKAELYALKIL
jgi:hypothetical protein